MWSYDLIIVLFCGGIKYVSGFPGGSGGKNLPTRWKIGIRSLGQEDSMEKEVVTHFRILAWRVPWTEEPCGLQSMGLQSRT